MLNPGDVFVAMLPDGRYVAVRVLRTVGRSSLVCTSPYLGAERPLLDDPLLRETVVQERFFFERQPAREWLKGAPPTTFEFLGNIPPTKSEAEMECSLYGGKWAESSGREAFLEWRWLHDRAAFEEEVRKRKEEFERRRRLPQKPKKMLPEEEFWSIIDLLDWKHQGNNKKVLAPAIKALAARPKAEICQFQNVLRSSCTSWIPGPTRATWANILTIQNRTMYPATGSFMQGVSSSQMVENSTTRS